MVLADKSESDQERRLMGRQQVALRNAAHAHQDLLPDERLRPRSRLCHLRELAPTAFGVSASNVQGEKMKTVSIVLFASAVGCAFAQPVEATQAATFKE